MRPRLVAITAEHTQAYREVRLRALADSPSAFGSTLARESAFTDEIWLDRSRNLDGSARVGYLAVDPAGHTCGLGLAFLDAADPAVADVISFWVAPQQRGNGLAREILHALLEWASSRGARLARLMVTSGNDRAIAFYRSNGFTPTGRTEPYPHDTALQEIEMTRVLGG